MDTENIEALLAELVGLNQQLIARLESIETTVEELRDGLCNWPEPTTTSGQIVERLNTIESAVNTSQ